MGRAELGSVDLTIVGPRPVVGWRSNRDAGLQIRRFDARPILMREAELHPERAGRTHQTARARMA